MAAPILLLQHPPPPSIARQIPLASCPCCQVVLLFNSCYRLLTSTAKRTNPVPPTPEIINTVKRWGDSQAPSLWGICDGHHDTKETLCPRCHLLQQDCSDFRFDYLTDTYGTYLMRFISRGLLCYLYLGRYSRTTALGGRPERAWMASIWRRTTPDPWERTSHIIFIPYNCPRRKAIPFPQTSCYTLWSPDSMYML